MITVTFSEAEANMVRQALRAEEERMKKAGYDALSKVMGSALDALSGAWLDKKVLDSKMLIG